MQLTCIWREIPEGVSPFEKFRRTIADNFATVHSFLGTCPVIAVTRCLGANGGCIRGILLRRDSNVWMTNKTTHSDLRFLMLWLPFGPLVYEVIKFTSQYSESRLVRWMRYRWKRHHFIWWIHPSRKIKGPSKFMTISNAAKFRIQCSDFLASYSAPVSYRGII